MRLSEFIKKRKADLKLTWRDFEDAGLSSQTMHNLSNDKQRNIKPVTREKLAEVLKCSQGDIQACMAEAQDPLKKEAEKPEGQAGISITAGHKKTAKKTTPAPAPVPDPVEEEPAEVFQQEYIPDTDVFFPQDDYRNFHQRKKLEPEETAKQYRQKLRDMVLRVMASGRAGEDTLGDVYTDIGIALVKELVSYDE